LKDNISMLHRELFHRLHIIYK